MGAEVTSSTEGFFDAVCCSNVSRTVSGDMVTSAPGEITTTSFFVVGSWAGTVTAGVVDGIDDEGSSVGCRGGGDSVRGPGPFVKIGGEVTTGDGDGVSFASWASGDLW